MPVIIVDTEQADLMEAAFLMLEAALTARVKRADPEEIISNSLKLQALKLGTVRTLLRSPDPPAFSALDKSLRDAADAHLFLLHTKRSEAEKDASWEKLRGIINAPGLPRT